MPHTLKLVYQGARPMQHSAIVLPPLQVAVAIFANARKMGIDQELTARAYRKL